MSLAGQFGRLSIDWQLKEAIRRWAFCAPHPLPFVVGGSADPISRATKRTIIPSVCPISFVGNTLRLINKIVNSLIIPVKQG